MQKPRQAKLMYDFNNLCFYKGLQRKNYEIKVTIIRKKCVFLGNKLPSIALTLQTCKQTDLQGIRKGLSANYPIL